MEPVPVTVGDAADVYAVDIRMCETPQYGTVYIIDGEQSALVDTGTGANYDEILDALVTVGVGRRDLDVILPTHVHLDHAGGVGYLARECPNADVYVHEVGARHLVDPERLWAGTKQAVPDWLDYYAEPVPVPADRIVKFADGDAIDLGDRVLEVHNAPGHAPHHAVFDDLDHDCVFVADAVGLYVPSFDRPYPTTPPPNFDLERSLADLSMLQDLDRSGLLLAHAGAVPADSHLSAYGAALESWVAAVEAAREAAGTDDVSAIVDRLDPWPDAAAVWSEAHVRESQALNVRGVLARD